MSSHLVKSEAHLGAIRQLTQLCLRQEAVPHASQQSFYLSTLDRKLLNALVTESPATSLKLPRSFNSTLFQAPHNALSARRASTREASIRRSYRNHAHYSSDSRAPSKEAKQDPARLASSKTENLSEEDVSRNGHSEREGTGERAANFFTQALRDMARLETTEHRMGKRGPLNDVGKSQAQSVGSESTRWPSPVNESRSNTRVSVPRGHGQAVEGMQVPQGSSVPPIRRVPAEENDLEQQEELDPESSLPPSRESSALIWKTVETDISLADDSPLVDLFSNGKWRPGVSGRLAHRIWRMFSNEPENSKSSLEVQQLFSHLGLSRDILECPTQGKVDIATMRKAWLGLPRAKRVISWRDIVLLNITTSVDDTLKFLEATHQDLPYVPWLFIFSMNVLRWWRWEEVNRRHDRREIYNRLAQWAVRKSIEIEHVQSWRACPMLLENSTAEQGQKIFILMMTKYTAMSATMALRFMNFFTAVGNVEYALKAFHEAAKFGNMLNDEFMLRSCSLLLELDYVDRSEHGQNFRILPELLGAGIEPNLIIHNITLSNSFRCGLSSVVWDVFKYMRTSGLPTDSYTYLPLLQDCVKTGDISNLSEILSEINGREDLANNAHLNAQTLYAIKSLYGTQSQAPSAALFDQQLAFYMKRFKIAPLKRILDLPIDVDADTEERKIEPPPTILGMLTYSYITRVLGPTTAVQLWLRFREGVAQEDAFIAPLAETDHIYNAFLNVFGRTQATLIRLLEVLNFMLTEHSGNHCKVEGHSFLLVAVGLLRHGKSYQAKKVLELMRLKGLSYEAHTFRSTSEQWIHSRLRPEIMHMMDRVDREISDMKRGRSPAADLESWAEAVSAESE